MLLQVCKLQPMYMGVEVCRTWM